MIGLTRLPRCAGAVGISPIFIRSAARQRMHIRMCFHVPLAEVVPEPDLGGAVESWSLRVNYLKLGKCSYGLSAWPRDDNLVV